MRQLQHPGFLQGGHGGEVKVFQPLRIREARLVEAALDLVLAPLTHLVLQERLQVVQIADLLCLGFARARDTFPSDGWQVHLLEIALNQGRLRP